MSDAFTGFTPPAPEPVAPAAPPVAEPAAPAAPANDAPVDYSAHPVWGKAVEAIPEVLRGPLYETIRQSEREAQIAIEKAHEERTPREWQELLAEAQQMGLTPEQLAEAYVSQSDLQKLLLSDPDGFIETMTQQIDALVASGQITRKEGAAAKQQAAELTDPLETDEQREIRELKAWREQEQARRTAEQQAQQAAEAERQREAELDRQAQQFFTEFDRQMIEAGYAQIGANGQRESIIAVETLQMIGEVAGNLVDRGTPLAQAIQQAKTHVERQIEAAGGKLGPARTPAPPVVGGSATIPGQQVDPNAKPRTQDQRENDMLATIAQMRAAG